MIVQCIVASFMAEALAGTHVLATDVIKMALYSSDATLGAATTAYTATGEVSAAGYSAGGATLTGVTVTQGTYGPYVDFADVAWSAAITARGALIYNSSKSNKAIAVLDFGADKTSTTTFTVTLPDNTESTALLRFAPQT